MKVRIKQVFTTERVIVVDVDQPDMESALEEVRSDTESFAPDFKDPRWKEGWNLQSEIIEPAE